MNQPVVRALGSGSVYSIPPYQRQYQWGEDLWQGLIHDVLAIQTSKNTDPPHWLGILLLTSEDTVLFPGDDSLANFTVIDGQQRLVTLVIWLSALHHHAKDVGETIHFDLSRMSKINVQKVDQIPLKVVLEDKWLDPLYESFAESQILRAYRYFRFILWLGQDALLEEQFIKAPKFKYPKESQTIISMWEKHLSSARGKEIPRGASVTSQDLIEATRKRLYIFTLIHEPRIDEPQAVIFDTLNGARTPLEPLDHVRNSIFVRLAPAVADEVYSDYWAPSENALRDLKLAYQKPGINFLYDYVISKGERNRQGPINKERGAGHFTRMTRNVNDGALAEFIKNDVAPSMATWPVVVGKRSSVNFNGIETDFSVRTLELTSSIRDLSKNPANPLVLLYLTARVRAKIKDVDLESRLSIIENYLVRQVLSQTPLSPLRARIMEVAGYLDCRLDEISLKEGLKKFGWISDATIMKDSLKRPFYEEAGPSALGAIFRGIERHLSGVGAMKFRIGADHYTIEHIYPKNDALWESDFVSWKTTSKRVNPYLNTLGNLTVVTQEHNSKVGNKPLAKKQAYPLVPGASAPLRLHESWITAERWTEKEIQERTQFLIDQALKYWKEI